MNKKLIYDIIKSWIRVICIVSLFGCVVLSTFVFYHFIVYGGIILYEVNLTISIMEFVLGIIAILYCCYIVIKLKSE